ncbi:MAG: hypothetical protein WB952_11560 [Terriglobales bacterium]
MSPPSNSNAILPADDRITIAAIAVLAFVFADVGHEVVGHGLGFLIAGGRSGIFTTTRLIETQRLGDRGGRIFDLGGPLGNLVFAGLAWLGQRLFRRSAPGLRLLLWLLMAFSLFWGFGYLIFCGVFNRGDWLALIPGTSHLWLWRVAFFAGGIGLYRGSERLVASELRWIISPTGPNWSSRVGRSVFTSYVAGGLIACAGAALDPRGAFEMLNSGALSGFAAAIGLLQVPRLFSLSGDEHATAQSAVYRSLGWIVAAAAVSIFYIGILGPGIKATF